MNDGYQNRGGSQYISSSYQPKSERMLPLPESIRQKANQLTHPGLALDKFAKTIEYVGNEVVSRFDQNCQKSVLEQMIQISQGSEPQEAWKRFHSRQRQIWQNLNCKTLEMQTVSGLSLHLARASALENAGICLHQIYGFPIIPGSGLKGMVRAWATLEEKDPGLIEAIFGPNVEDVRAGTKERMGQIIFHDAIPAAWPELMVDIVNNHHKDYYSGNEKNGYSAPGDWEEPSPVYFLTIRPNARFVFSLGKARTDVPDQMLEQVSEWLLAALSWSGAGAKTNAGYGIFKPLLGDLPEPPLARATYNTTLELVSPAFFAGALQDGSDCDLRPASLRGMLRWWWRTLYSGYLDSKQMLELEAQIFGSSSEGGALQIRVVSKTKKETYPYDKRLLVTGYPDTGDKKTTQGLWYHSFGMDEREKKRHFLPQGASWEIGLLAKDLHNIKAQIVLEQAQSALFLLCHFGSLGAKQRKGWGSFAAIPDFSLQTCKDAALRLRKNLGLHSSFNASKAMSPSLELMLEPLEIVTNWSNPFWALHQIGMAAQEFAQVYKHDLAKKALGLPRKIGAPFKGSFHSAKQKLNEPKARYSSPTQFHLAQNAQGNYVIRISFFPSAVLPDLQTSRAFLQKYREALEKGLSARLGSHLSGPQHLPSTSTQRGYQPTSSRAPQYHGQSRGGSRPVQMPAHSGPAPTLNTTTEYTGVITNVLYDRNIGFIKNEQLHSGDHFFRLSSFQGNPDNLAKGMKVRFHLEKGFDRHKNKETWNAVRILKL